MVSETVQVGADLVSHWRGPIFGVTHLVFGFGVVALVAVSCVLPLGCLYILISLMLRPKIRFQK